MAHISSGESSKPQSPQKAFLMGEWAERTIAQKDEVMWQMEEILQRLELAYDRPQRERKHHQRHESRGYQNYGGHERRERMEDASF